MTLNKIFQQAVLGLAMTAGIAAPVQAQVGDYTEARREPVCQVVETGASMNGNLQIFYDYDKEIVAYVTSFAKRFRSAAAPMSLRVMRAEDLDIRERDRYEGMKQYLSPYCKQKLGVM